LLIVQGGSIIPDKVGLNGYRSRFTVLTAPGVVSGKISNFNGTVLWVGLTCNTTYEVLGGGPFTHRRILFASTVPWPAGGFSPRPVDAVTGIGSGECVRDVAKPLSDGTNTACLRRLFQQNTIRGTIQGPVSALGVRVIVDETFRFNGVDDGVRKTKKFWNSFKKEVPMKYMLTPNGTFDTTLQNSPDSQHIFMVDIFSYGLKGLDEDLPVGGQSNVDTSQSRGNKRMKSDDSVMSGYSSSSFGLGGIATSLDDPTEESFEDGEASIVTEMKLYFKEGKA
jgi:hypothetical protein